MREWCFRSSHGQKAQNHRFRAALAWLEAPKPEQFVSRSGFQKLFRFPARFFETVPVHAFRFAIPVPVPNLS